MDAGKDARTLPYLSLGIVYVVWSSTFLAMRIGVRPGSGFEPWVFGGTRVLAGGALLLVVAFLLGRRLRIPRSAIVPLMVSGNLIWITGHGFLLWAEQWADSGYTGLFIAAFPILAAVYDAVLDRRPPSWLVVAGLLGGFAGIVLLMAPEWTKAEGLQPIVLAALAIAPVAWAAGFTVQRRMVRNVPALTASGYQHLFSVPVYGLLFLAAGEPIPDPSPDALWAWVYLVVFGSAIAYSAAVHALNNLPPRIAMTYGYVNPVFAVVLGHIVLNEPVSGIMVLGGALVLVGVYLVFRDRPLSPRPARGAATVRGGTG